jgi:guanine deaminase
MVFSCILAIGQYNSLVWFTQALHRQITGRFTIPGLIDSHLHYPQTEMIAKYGEKLLTLV